jgi:Na+/proline symporter/nitrogen-specific signal transduction histidine kinase
MLTFNILVLVSLGYVAFLFGVAFLAERQAQGGRSDWLRSPLVYTLSLSIYCTAWTFYGAVGNAARSGFEFLTIYLGPSLVMLGWWGLLRKMVRIGKVHRITSIADLVSSRYGKSALIGVVVTLIALAGVTPYIALQLQSITLSYAVFAGTAGEAWPGTDLRAVAFWSAVGLAFFTILFGTRNLDANERHHGVVMAIAVEAVVKFTALIAVGIFVVWGLGGGLGATLARIDAAEATLWDQSGGRWIGLTFVAAAAFVTLPRMFQVMVVENADERHLATAGWAFPAYVMGMSLFVVPIAVTGLDLMPAGANPDMFVLTVPLAADRPGLAMLAFLGGFSSATSMVIVASIALATMISNHILVPVWIAAMRPDQTERSDLRRLVLNLRRLSVAGVLALGYAYYSLAGGGAALAAMGLIAFLGVAQILPGMLGGLYWRGATAAGAAAGLVTGAAIWAWTLFLPSFGSGAIIPPEVLVEGPWGLEWLRPQALFGIVGLDPLMHALIWSIGLNTLVFVVVSLVTFPAPLERLQGAAFVNVFEVEAPGARAWTAATARVEAEDLLVLAQRILGPGPAQAVFQAAARAQGKAGFLPDVTPAFVGQLERELAGTVGAATAHAMMAQATKGATVTVADLMRVADETAQIMEARGALQAKTDELGRTARALQDANEKLTRLAVQKDEFLSQISHELRTPMTSIRSFSGLLQEPGLDPANQIRFAGIIEAEALRLTRLLDELLDLSVLENGQVVLAKATLPLRAIIDRAVTASAAEGSALRIHRNGADESVLVETDPDRLAQVFINLISNAIKYAQGSRPVLRIVVGTPGPGGLTLDFVDNGPGIPAADQDLVFEKFARLSPEGTEAGAGLGLAICREIMDRLGGAISYLPGQGGAAFRVTLPPDVLPAEGPR